MGFLRSVLRAERRGDVTDERLWRWPWGVRTKAGVDVDFDRALRLASVWSAVKVLSEDISRLPLFLYRRFTDGSREMAREHPLWSLLHSSPNDQMTSVEFRESMQMRLLLRGNAYVFVGRDDNGSVTELFPLPLNTRRMVLESGRVVYVSTVGIEKLVYDPINVMHLRGLSLDGVHGLDPILYHRETIGHGLATQEHGSRFFGSGAQLTGILKHPAALSDVAAANLRKSFNQVHSGVDNRWKVLILEEGMDFREAGVTPEAAQYIETRKFTVSDIARIFRVPPHLLADLDKATFNNIEELGLGYVVYSLSSWLVRWEQRIAMSLLRPAERLIFFAEHSVMGLLRGDIEKRYRAYATARQWGWMSRNEIRRLENMNPLPADIGDNYLDPLNMVPSGAIDVDDLPDGQDPEPDRVPVRNLELRQPSLARLRLRDRFRPLLENAANQVVVREVADIQEQLDKWRERQESGEIVQWFQDYYRGLAGFLSAALSPVWRAFSDAVVDAAAIEVGADPDNVDVADFVDSYVDGVSADWASMSVGQMAEIVQQDDVVGDEALDRIKKRVTSWEETRASKVAMSHATRGVSGIARAVWLAVGILTFRWRTVGDNCPYCVALGNRTVGRNETFIGNGALFQPSTSDRPLSPSRDIFHPPAHRGCNCILMPNMGG